MPHWEHAYEMKDTDKLCLQNSMIQVAIAIYISYMHICTCTNYVYMVANNNNIQTLAN